MCFLPFIPFFLLSKISRWGEFYSKSQIQMACTSWTHPHVPLMLPILVKERLLRFGTADLINSLPVSINKALVVCPACQQAKSHQLPFPASLSSSRYPLDLLFTNVWGPYPVVSNNGNLHLWTI